MQLKSKFRFSSMQQKKTDLFLGFFPSLVPVIKANLMIFFTFA